MIANEGERWPHLIGNLGFIFLQLFRAQNAFVLMCDHKRALALVALSEINRLSINCAMQRIHFRL